MRGNVKIQRQVIRKQVRRESAGADGQLWPVGAALFVTATLGLVAALTTLDPRWRWISVVLVPAGLWVGIWGLQRVGHRWLRRSLQFAILCSLSLHLLLMIIATLTRVFGESGPEPPEQVARARPTRVILTSRPTAEPIWEQVNRRSVEEPQLDPSRVATLTETQPVPVELKSDAARAESSLARRDTRKTESVPRLDESLSERRRSESGATPASTAAASLPNPARTANATPPTPTVSDATAQAEPAARAADSPAAAAPTAPAVSRPGVSKAEPLTPRRSENRIAELDAAESSSRAVVRSRTERLPDAQASPAPAAASSNREPSQTNPVSEALRPAETSARSEAAATAAPEATVSDQPRSIQRDAPRRQNEPRPAAPSIAAADANAPQARRSRTQAARATTTSPAETPSLANRPTTQSGEQPQPSATSVTRADSAGALATSMEGFVNQAATTAGAAPAASNARRETTAASLPSELQLLQNQTASRSRETTASTALSSNALAANTNNASLLNGSNRPDDSSNAAPQAQTTSASRDPRMELAAQPGESSFDSRPVKRTGDLPSRADSGGGRPEIDMAQNAEESNARTRGSSEPSRLMAQAADVTAAERTPSTSDSAAGETPEAGETAAGRTALAEGDSPAAPELNGEAPRATASRDSAERQSRGRDVASGESMGDPSDEDDDEEQRRSRRASPRSQAAEAAAEIALGDGDSPQRATRPELTDSDAERQTTPGRRDPGTAGSDADGRILAEASEATSERSSDRPGPARPQSRRGSSVAAADSDNSAAPGERSRTDRQAPAGTAAAPLAAAGSAASQTSAQSPEAGTTSDRMGESMALEIDAQLGPAGLGDQPSRSLGTPIRPGNRESRSIQLDSPSRFVRDASSTAAPSTDAAAPMARQAFQSRQPSGASSSPSTEASIELGLEFLARHQQPDGSWSLEMFDTNHPSHQQQLVSSTAATGLAVLAFQGAGYHHRDFKYAQVVSRALTWLVDHQQEDGNLYVAAEEESNRYSLMYSHAIGTLALAEAWGMTQDPALRAPCERAVGFIVATQDPRQGGWRYRPEAAQRMTDTSVTGWMLMALQSSRQGGIEVPDQTIEGIERWLAVAHDPANPSLFRYDPYAENTGSIQRVQQRNVSPAMTAVGLLMRIYLDSDREGVLVQNGADYLLERLPSARDGLARDTYYWYYATQVLRHVGGERWQRWNSVLHPLLVNSQEKSGSLAGSWHPYEPVPDRWGPFAGRLYVTTMNLLSLEVDYRLLPLYEKNTDR